MRGLAVPIQNYAEQGAGHSLAAPASLQGLALTRHPGACGPRLWSGETPFTSATIRFIHDHIVTSDHKVNLILEKMRGICICQRASGMNRQVQK
jgi:hypothetical protein